MIAWFMADGKPQNSGTLPKVKETSRILAYSVSCLLCSTDIEQILCRSETSVS